MVFRVQELVLGGARSQHLLSSSSHPEVAHPSSPTGQFECSWGNKAEEPMPSNIEIPSNLLRTVACICCETHRAGHLATATLRVVSCFPAPLEMQWQVAALSQLGPLYLRPWGTNARTHLGLLPHLFFPTETIIEFTHSPLSSTHYAGLFTLFPLLNI